MMIIRQYKKADEAAVWALHNAALVPTGAHAGNGPWDDDLHHIPEIYLSPGGEFLVGVVEKEIVAMGALKRISPTRAEVKRMRVLPRHQRQGFGQAILRSLETRARELGISTLCLDTTTQQEPAQALYRKNGFREVGRRQQGAFEVIFFEKELREPALPAYRRPGAASG